MQKYLHSTLLGGITMFIVAMGYSLVQMQIVGADIYGPPLFHDPTSDYMRLYFFPGYLALQLLTAFLISYLHESLPRCGGTLWSKAWRFAGLAWALVHLPGLLMTALSMPIPFWMIASWALSGALTMLAGSLVVVRTLYRYPAPDHSCTIGKK